MEMEDPSPSSSLPPPSSSLVSAEDSRTTAWHCLPVSSALSYVDGSIEGLPQDEIEDRKSVYGPNQLPTPPSPTLIARIWGQLNNALILILIVSAVITGAFQQWADMALVLLVVIVNVIVGLIQEGKAEKSAGAIKNLLSSNAVVVREGVRMTVTVDSVVFGDVVFVESGDRIPADVRWISVNNLHVQEALLTGESKDVLKTTEPSEESASLAERKCMGFSGTTVTKGQGSGIVVATGVNAQIGQITTLVNSVESGKTPLLMQLEVSRGIHRRRGCRHVASCILSWII